MSAGTDGQELKTDHLVEAKAVGVDHGHLMNAADLGTDLVVHTATRHVASHAEALRAWRASVDLDGYARLRAGVLDADGDVAARSVNSSGGEPTHTEVIAAHAAGIPLTYYADTREVGADHHEILAAHTAGIPLTDHAVGWHQGGDETDPTHHEVMAARATGMPLADYRRRRDLVGDHEAVMAEWARGHGPGVTDRVEPPTTPAAPSPARTRRTSDARTPRPPATSRTVPWPLWHGRRRSQRSSRQRPHVG